MDKKIAVILGDGIGPEVTHQSIKVLNSVATKFRHHFTYTYSLMGAIAIDKTGDPLPQRTIDMCHASDAILFGAIGYTIFPR
jgi:3-isopropylmalate dehydrogenase